MKESDDSVLSITFDASISPGIAARIASTLAGSSSPTITAVWVTASATVSELAAARAVAAAVVSRARVRVARASSATSSVRPTELRASPVTSKESPKRVNKSSVNSQAMIVINAAPTSPTTPSRTIDGPRTGRATSMGPTRVITPRTLRRHNRNCGLGETVVWAKLWFGRKWVRDLFDCRCLRVPGEI